jgi:hypothetical protein
VVPPQTWRRGAPNDDDAGNHGIMETMQWETVDENAMHPVERYRAVEEGHEYRISYDPETTNGRPWLLTFRELGDIHGLILLGDHPSEYWAKEAAEEC